MRRRIVMWVTAFATGYLMTGCTAATEGVGAETDTADTGTGSSTETGAETDDSTGETSGSEGSEAGSGSGGGDGSTGGSHGDSSSSATTDGADDETGTSEGSESTDGGDSNSEESSDTGATPDPYGPCSDVGTCDPGLECQQVGPWGVCTHGCDQTSDCPDPGSDRSAVCLDVGEGVIEGPQCHIACDPFAPDCPAGALCNQPGVCLFE